MTARSQLSQTSIVVRVLAFLGFVFFQADIVSARCISDGCIGRLLKHIAACFQPAGTCTSEVVSIGVLGVTCWSNGARIVGRGNLTSDRVITRYFGARGQLCYSINEDSPLAPKTGRFVYKSQGRTWVMDLSSSDDFRIRCPGGRIEHYGPDSSAPECTTGTAQGGQAFRCVEGSCR